MSRELTATLAIIVSGIYMAPLWTLAIERVWIWAAMEPADFARDFRRSLLRIDLVQPAGAILAFALAIGYATTVGGSARVLSIIAAALLGIIIVISVAIGVPMQKLFRSVDEGEFDPSAIDVPVIRSRWIRLHLVRTALGVVAFVLLVIAGIYP